MELTDSNDSKPDTRSPLGIDLNEIPSSSFTETLPESAEPDSFSVVRAIHENPDPALGEPAGVPIGNEREQCGACGLPEAMAGGGRVVVCDGCERGFHLACSGASGSFSAGEEWVCGVCVGRGVRSKRWPLGFKAKKRVLDINASPPSDGDGEGDEMQELTRQHMRGDNSFVGKGLGAPLTYMNSLFSDNGFGSQKAPRIVTHAVKMGFEDIMHRMQTRDRSFDDIDLDSPLRMLRNSNNTAIRFPTRNPSDVFLQALREFVSERHGVLEEGWRVELKHSMSGCDLYAVYCAPDGKTFGSVAEVASYLGLVSSYNPMDAEIKHEGGSHRERLHLPRKRKSTRFKISGGFPENKGSLINGYYKEFPCDGQILEKHVNKSCIMKITEAMQDDKSISGSEQINDGLPVQFEDFFVLTLGVVDTRPSYHDASLIFPIGYKSCWHDKITGSLFTCEVLDGGDSGPIFKIRRCSCSALPLPIGSTVLFLPKIEQTSSHNNEGYASYFNNKEFDDDDSIQRILTDPCPPIENDILTCLKSSLKETYIVQRIDESQHEAGLMCEKSGDKLIDEIGEISVEDHSFSDAWRIISQKFIDACSEISKRKGALKFSCKHAGKEIGSSYWDMMDGKYKETLIPLAKFCGFPVSLSLPFEYRANELETWTEELTKWLEQGRFGLDAEFVQEIIEELPGVEACSRYESLRKRSSYSGSLTIRNGHLKIKTPDGLECDGEEGLDGLFRKSKKPRLVDDHGLPAGKPLSLRLPPELFGDFHQVWELLWRFGEVMGLQEIFLANELEQELINPWSNHSNFFHKFGCENQGTDVLSLSRIDSMYEKNVSPSGDSCMANSTENPHPFIQMETGEMMEADQARLAPLSYRRCFGMALTKVHSSLLAVLISELQSKVAALVDPNFDSGESKSKRGRKKDLDSTAPSKKVKLSVLPINELTWPELARRYMLSFLSMDGNLDSAEITARESAKVFRCLQGDGGVLCGSLTGVAGMEADALLLAEATKKIFGSLNRQSDVLTVEDEGAGQNVACEKNFVNGGDIPEWAKLLEPVKKLPTNVGTRIRKCVYEALEKDPPEWAREKLRHSISKEVYKGNASGPTKKAVLSVLADVQNECSTQKSDKETSKKKIVLTVSDVIMKQCRIILRRAAAADDSKVFCNLLGRKLMNSSDNDDEGLLGPPAMVSRPLDFRTIDLRLAVGAYGGSHETFLEDVRELWSDVRSAFTDQPDLVDSVESLSQNFESLYEEEVLVLVQKFAEYAKLDCLNAETKKEINNILVSTSDIPKAPWDEGVCKVCGIDKDDDSVLLCDTCDAEYHTYCLNPPLARIPEGNWYCPACVGMRMVQDALQPSHVIIRRRSKKYQGEVTRGYLEALAHLAAMMEEKEYWQLSVDERTFLLKFLCDELLNSALIRQHLERCAETTFELHQKLRTAYAEWKNLKSKEDFVAARAAKFDTSVINANGDGVTDGGDRLPSASEEGGADLNGSNKYESGTHMEKSFTSNGQCVNPMDTEARLKGEQAIVDVSEVLSEKSDKSSRTSELPVSNPLAQEIDDSRKETDFHGKLEESKGTDLVSPSSPSDCNGQCHSSDATSLHAAKQVSSVAENESQSHHLELNTIKSDIKHQQDLITSLESQLIKLSIRKEFLGSDSSGRLYWISAMPGGYPQIIVDGSLVLHKRRNFLGNEAQRHSTSVNLNFTSATRDTSIKAQGSKASCPFVYNAKDAISVGPSWVTYQSDPEIERLINWLNDNDPKEKELKEAICQKLKFQNYQKMRKEVQDECQAAFSLSNISDKASVPSFLVTKAAMSLEKKYGPCLESEITESVKKHGKKAEVIIEDKVYRCKCLEPVWPSRNHCISCHKTFLTDVDFKDHNDGKCTLDPPANDKGKSVSDSVKGKGDMKSDANRVGCTVDMEIDENSKGGHSEMSSRLTKFQTDGVVCPYDFEEISTKFVTRDSNKELVQEIGLISSDGVPSFVSSVPHFVGDPSLLIVLPHQEIEGLGDEVKAAKRPGLSLGNWSVGNGVKEGFSDGSFKRSAANDIKAQKNRRPALRCSEQRDRISLAGKYSPELGKGRCCVVPQSSLRPVVGKISQLLRQLKINLLDMDAALSEEALRPSKACMERRWAWRSFVKSAETIYEMVQATIAFEDMIKTEYLRNEWWYWSSLSAAAKVSTMSSLALRIYSLDAIIVYEKSSEFLLIDHLKPSSIPGPKLLSNSDLPEKSKVSRKTGKKRKEPEG
ncbi:7-dimethyl-8-ribityllumazine synthase family protein [Hibiscus syriacus]|uniref:7-dimethyl-8-ribityllumazine synthase family protein n=1 Tax=Hibiscus syriacus TaxID=106335 RepID=A0A6A3BQS1_HIBSY|nr:methyl-CpG-binding domain-containing protein 9-like [Hibiscus syriacus]KAE8718221.1 7-dimethyl-8-ribityllumazine synthase family protein [Hibiscus syriacus]